MKQAALFAFCTATLISWCVAPPSFGQPNPTETKPTEQNEPKEESPDAPVYSYDMGVQFLEEASSNWREKRNCVTCHTNGWALAAQPVIAPGSEEVDAGRTFAQEYLNRYLEEGKTPRGQHGALEGMVATTAFLALSDARSGEGRHPMTVRGLDYAWEHLDKSGTWEDWLQCNWPPYESDAEFGPTLMLVALGELREADRIRTVDRSRANRLVRYLKKNAPVSGHGKGMRLWASTYWPSIASSKRQNAWRKELLAAQGEDGGWSMASLAGPAWKRDGGEPQTTSSEAYATAFVVYVLLRTGAARDEKEVQQGLEWLKAHQDASGRWFTRSPRRDGKHFISHAATAFALMALADDEE